MTPAFSGLLIARASPTRAAAGRAIWLAAVLVLAAGLGGCGGADGGQKTVVVYGFSIMEEVLKEDIIPAFQLHWKEETGEEVEVITSFAGSGTVTNQIVFGAPAQVAMVATRWTP